MDCWNRLTAPWINGEELRHIRGMHGDHSLTTIKATRQRSDGTVGTSIDYVYNPETQELYRNDSVSLIGLKCAILLIGTPIYTLGRCIYHLLRVAYVAVKVFVEVIVSVVEELRTAEKGTIWTTLFRRLAIDTFKNLLLQAIITELWSAIKAPYYGLGVWVSCLEGVLVDPYKAMTKIAVIERKWNDDHDRTHDPRMWIFSHPNSHMLHADALFLAFCMQPVGTLSDTVRCQQEEEAVGKTKFSQIEVAKQGKWTGTCTFPPLLFC